MLDVRILALAIQTSVPRRTLILSFKGPARQELTQEIPILNSSDGDWILTASIQGMYVYCRQNHLCLLCCISVLNWDGDCECKMICVSTFLFMFIAACFQAFQKSWHYWDFIRLSLFVDYSTSMFFFISIPFDFTDFSSVFSHWFSLSLSLSLISAYLFIFLWFSSISFSILPLFILFFISRSWLLRRIFCVRAKGHHCNVRCTVPRNSSWTQWRNITSEEHKIRGRFFRIQVYQPTFLDAFI